MKYANSMILDSLLQIKLLLIGLSKNSTRTLNTSHALSVDSDTGHAAPGRDGWRVEKKNSGADEY